MNPCIGANEDPGDFFSCIRCGEETHYGDALQCPFCSMPFCSEQCYHTHLINEHPKEWNEKIDFLVRNGG